MNVKLFPTEILLKLIHCQWFLSSLFATLALSFFLKDSPCYLYRYLKSSISLINFEIQEFFKKLQLNI